MTKQIKLVGNVFIRTDSIDTSNPVLYPLNLDTSELAVNEA